MIQGAAMSPPVLLAERVASVDLRPRCRLLDGARIVVLSMSSPLVGRHGAPYGVRRTEGSAGG